MEPHVEITHKETMYQISYELLGCLWVDASFGTWWINEVRVVAPSEWVYEDRVLPPDPGKHNSWDYPLNPGGALKIKCEDDDKEYTLNLETMKRAMELLAKNDPELFEQILDEQYDAGGANTWLQYALFGKIEY